VLDVLAEALLNDPPRNDVPASDANMGVEEYDGEVREVSGQHPDVKLCDGVDDQRIAAEIENWPKTVSVPIDPPLPLTLASPCVTCRKPPATPIPAPPCATTAAEDHSTGMRPRWWHPSWPAPPGDPWGDERHRAPVTLVLPVIGRRTCPRNRAFGGTMAWG
jgi:hypothetical protein